jgi:hypothetical protein
MALNRPPTALYSLQWPYTAFNGQLQPPMASFSLQRPYTASNGQLQPPMVSYSRHRPCTASIGPVQPLIQPPMALYSLHRPCLASIGLFSLQQPYKALTPFNDPQKPQKTSKNLKPELFSFPEYAAHIKHRHSVELRMSYNKRLVDMMRSAS